MEIELLRCRCLDRSVLLRTLPDRRSPDSPSNTLPFGGVRSLAILRAYSEDGLAKGFVSSTTGVTPSTMPGLLSYAALTARAADAPSSFAAASSFLVRVLLRFRARLLSILVESSMIACSEFMEVSFGKPRWVRLRFPEPMVSMVDNCRSASVVLPVSGGVGREEACSSFPGCERGVADLGRAGLLPNVFVMVLAVFWAALMTEEKNPVKAIWLPEAFVEPGVFTSSRGVKGGVDA